MKPDEVGSADVDQLRAAGVSDEAIEDAIHVCVSFVLINKLADALGWDVMSPEVYDRRGAIKLERGYFIPDEFAD